MFKRISALGVIVAVAGMLLTCSQNPTDTSTEPTITTQPHSRAVVASRSVTFTVTAVGTAPLSYQWQKSGNNISGQTATTYIITSAAFSDTGDYTVIVSNKTGSVISNPATLTVWAITTQPQSKTVNAGQTVTFTFITTGTTYPTYQWRKNGVNISNANAPYYFINSVTLADSGAFSVIVTNSGENDSSDVAMLTVYAPATITTQPHDTTVVVGNSASFSVVVTGYPAPTYQWKKNGITLVGDTTATISITSAQLTDTGSYTVAVTNIAGTVTSNPARLRVFVPPAITAQPHDSTVKAGNSVSFTVVATDFPTPSYQWKKDGVTLAGDTSATINITRAQFADTGTYVVIVSNIAGSVTSNQAKLALIPQLYSPVAAWYFDEGSGDTAYDASGNGNDGVVHSGTWIQRDALNFDGVSSWVDCGGNTSLQTDSALALEAWVYFRSFPTFNGIQASYIISRQTLETADGFFGLYVLNQKPHFRLAQNGDHAIASPDSVYPNQWYHFVGTWNGDSLRLYINGQRSQEITPLSGTINANPGNVQIGKLRDISFQYHVDGIIDEVSIYHCPLGQSQVDSLYMRH